MDNIIIICIERVYCCRSHESFIVEIEESGLRDDIIDGVGCDACIASDPI
jgi:hypothetical protein